MQRYKVTLELLTPVHIGCGEQFGWIDFVIAKQDSQYKMYIFDDVIATMYNQQIISREDLNKKPQDVLIMLQQELYNNRDKIKKFSNNNVNITQSIYDEYEEYMRKIQVKLQNKFNKWEIERTAYSAVSGTPYIPGSGVKGAIKTAWFNKKNIDKKINLKDWNEYQHRLLNIKGNNFSKDLFSRFKMSDFTSDNNSQNRGLVQYFHRVNKASLQHENKETGKCNAKINNNIKIRAELLMPNNDCSYSADLFLPKSNSKELENIDLSELVKACNNFYLPKLNDDLELLKTQTMPTKNDALSNAIKKKIDNLETEMNGGNCMIVNFGRYGGAINKRLDGVRSISSGVGKKKIKVKSPKSLWLCSDNKNYNESDYVYTLGWAILKFEEI